MESDGDFTVIGLVYDRISLQIQDGFNNIEAGLTLYIGRRIERVYTSESSSSGFLLIIRIWKCDETGESNLVLACRWSEEKKVHDDGLNSELG